MTRAFASVTCRFGHFLLGAPLAATLLLGPLSAQAQVVPTPAPMPAARPTSPTYYVDGKVTPKSELDKLNPNDISYMNVIKGAQQQQLFGTTNPDGAVVIATKSNANSPEALAFAKRIAEVVPLTPATPAQHAGVEAAEAYILKNYPNAKLQMVGPARDKPGYYQAFFMESGKRWQLLFDGQGQPVKQ